MVAAARSSNSLFLCPPPLVSPSPLVCNLLTCLHFPPAHAALGQLLKGATDENGAQKSAALLVGIKLDLEAEGVGGGSRNRLALGHGITRRDREWISYGRGRGLSTFSLISRPSRTKPIPLGLTDFGPEFPP